MMRSHTGGRWASGSRLGAFTLVELVVVGISVGLLISLLAPTLQAARGQSKLAVCLDRLHSIAQAGRVYSAGDAQGSSIPVHRLQSLQDHGTQLFIGAYEWGGKSGVGDAGHVEGPTEGQYAWITSRYGTRFGVGPATRPLNKILFPHGFRDNLSVEAGFDRQGAWADTLMELPVYRCPADNGPPAGGHCPDWIAHPERSSYDHYGTSYAANVFMIAFGPPSPMLSNSPYLRPLSRVPNPARTLNYEENIGRWAWAARRELDECLWLGPGIDVGPSGVLDGWHGKPWTYNRSFVDTHAETQKIYIEGTEDADGFANHYYNEVVFSDPGIQAINRCIIVRGDGWQKDTLPAKPIPTGLLHTDQGRPSYDGCVGASSASRSGTLPPARGANHR